MRIDYIDGLRGVFALLVVYIHYSAFFYVTLPEGFYNSCTMVCGFFIISGFVLSYRFWENREIKFLTQAALRRYVRLTAAPLVSILFACLLLKSGWIFNHEVCQLTESNKAMLVFYSFPADFFVALQEGLWGMYFHYDQAISYNPVLWTMAWELKGSFLAFAFLALFGKVKNRLPLYAIFVLLTFKTLYLTFVLGIMLADMVYSAEGKIFCAALKRQKFLSWLLLIVGLFLSYYALNFSEVYDKMNFQFFTDQQMIVEEFYHVLSAAFIIYALIQSDLLKKFFAWKYFVLVGKYSFSLYLIHAQILVSVSSIIFLKLFQAGWSMSACIFVATCAGLLTTIPATYLLHNFIDLPSSKLAKRFGKIFE